jgi:hypothetical protein
MADPFTRDLSEHLPLVIYFESNMIVAWVLSLLTLLSMMVIQLERLAALEVMSVKTYAESQKEFIAAEKSLLECEQYLSNITVLVNPTCHIQSAGKNLWLLSSNSKPSLEILIFLDEKTNIATRVNWRQNFE